MKNFKQFLIESSLQRIQKHVENRNIAMLSASRGDLSPAENNKRHRELKRRLREAGFGFVQVKGRYIENYGGPDARPVDEKSVLIIPKQKADDEKLEKIVKELAVHFNQDSVLLKKQKDKKAKLVGTKENAFPGKDKEFEVGGYKIGHTGEFYSILKNKPFGFTD